MRKQIAARRYRPLAATAALFAAMFGTAWASQEAERYFARRAQSQVVTARPEELATRPGAYRNRLIEIRGAVTGHARRDAGATLILSSEELTYLVEAPHGQAEDVEVGHMVRILARVSQAPSASTSAPTSEGQPVSSGAGGLTMVAITSEYAAAEWEQIQARRAATSRAKAARAAQHREKSLRSRAERRQLASRSYSVLEQYAAAVLYFNRRLSQVQATRIARSIIGYSNAYGLDARLVMAVIAVESNFRSDAVSPKGAMGLGQLMPGTAQDLGVQNPWSPEENIAGATRLLRGHLERMRQTPAGEVTEEQLHLALACYNAGLGAVKKYKGVPPYRETKDYVRKVTRLYRQMCGLSE
jgi:soluble lytic murein transglycosylase-like protein